MFKPVLRFFARLLPFAGAMMASVAIGASTPAPIHPSALQTVVRSQDAVLAAVRDRLPDDGSWASAQGLDRMRPIDLALIARADSIAAPMAAYPVEWLDPALVAPMMAPTTHGESWTSLHLPRPDRWTALLATLGLVAFFFLRRIV